MIGSRMSPRTLDQPSTKPTSAPSANPTTVSVSVTPSAVHSAPSRIHRTICSTMASGELVQKSVPNQVATSCQAASNPTMTAVCMVRSSPGGRLALPVGPALSTVVVDATLTLPTTRRCPHRSMEHGCANI
ncbi:hypothetical protein [Actinophytocola sp.]|uniref:hypothetical protein n=1 Tax=Actinophytocola sp. TaxID=1872138 RepID=UPI0025BC0377|nr:hypothetical protein [Actinophytocola sp.]